MVKRTTRSSLFLPLFPSFKQPLGVNEEVVTSDRSPPIMTASLKYLWEIMDHGNGNISREIREFSDWRCLFSKTFVIVKVRANYIFFRWSLEKHREIKYCSPFIEISFLKKKNAKHLHRRLYIISCTRFKR